MSSPLPRPRHLVTCTCGEMLEIWDLSDHLCVCGREYSADGRELTPRRFWGDARARGNR